MVQYTSCQGQMPTEQRHTHPQPKKKEWKQSVEKEEKQYYIVESSALPDIFHKVLEVKKLMALETAHTVHSATQQVGMSRSAFYKYKDLIRPFQDMGQGSILTIQFLMEDKPGILSEVLAIFAKTNINILTINQNIPSDHSAVVTISAQSSHLNMDDFLHTLSQVSGVVRCQLLAGS